MARGLSSRSRLRTPHPVDVHVGSRLRLRRTMLGMSQDKLGKTIDLTFQQVQKYERGANRVSAGRLFQLSHVLDVPVSFFFDEMPPDVRSRGTRRVKGLAEGGEPYGADPLVKRETLELVRAYFRIKDTRVRKKVFELAKALAKSGKGTTG